MLPYLLIPFLALSQAQPLLSEFRFSQSAESQLLYAEHLFDSKVYDSSILEYKRFLFYSPHTDLTDFARYRIAQSYYYRGDLGYAQELFKEFVEIYDDSPLYLHAQLMLGKTYFDEGDYATARSLFFLITSANSDQRLSAQAQYLRGWCYAHDRNWFKAIAEFRKVDQIQPGALLGTVSTQLADATLANTLLPLKSPKLARWLSTFIPGTGQIYAGRVGNGFISTAINATFFYFLADSILDKRYVDAAGIYLLGSRFYWGNRSNAKQWAIEHNQQLEENLIRQLKKQSAGIEQLESLPELPTHNLP